MSDQPSFTVPSASQAEQTTGLYVVTFRQDAVSEGMAVLNQECGVGQLPTATDFPDCALDPVQVESAGGAVFPTLGVAVVRLEKDALNRAVMAKGADAAILDIEPERIFYALGDGVLPLSYLRGYRDAVDHLYQKAAGPAAPAEDEGATRTADDAQSTWGLKATRVVDSRYSGRGTKIAVLDTGMDLDHPDFLGRVLLTKSFISGEDVADKNGHGTHCIGTACGFKDDGGRRYGVAHECIIFAGKVLSNAGSGSTSGILAGMEWAIDNDCRVISLSLGNRLTTPSTAYEAVARRALQRGCLVVAAAGNHHPNPIGIGQPANSPSIMAVGAMDERLRKASFSAVAGAQVGANVDIIAPGVRVYSSVPMPKRYEVFNGTSMATPHVAGIAALWSQHQGARGWELWALLMAHTRPLSLFSTEAGAGLVQAPRQ